MFTRVVGVRGDTTTGLREIRSEKMVHWLDRAEAPVLRGQARKIRNKFLKIARAVSHGNKPSDSLPIFWHVGVPNFGDDINPWFFNLICGSKVKLTTDQSQPHFLGVGSLLDRVSDRSVVLGSGMLDPIVKRHGRTGAHFASIRGELTAEEMRCGDDVLRGDPLVLSNLVFDIPKTRKYRLGIIPHVRSYDDYAKRINGRIKLIDPSRHPLAVIKDIASCDMIASQSLHGLIVADAFDIPNIWLEPSAGMEGGQFKFRDYFTTLDRDKEAMQLQDVMFMDPDQLPYEVAKYRYDKRRYLQTLCKTLRKGLN